MASTLHRWNPEDRGFWDTNGRTVATRNLWLAIPALILACAVWMIWSVLVIHLPAAGFQYSTNQLFWLVALPALSGATLRLIYAFGVPLVGGRRFTALATASLLLPASGIGFAVQDPGTPYEWMVVLALLCGLGGGNFAGSMANVSAFFPAARRHHALNLHAAFGSLGVAIVQFVVPLVIGVGAIGAFAGTSSDAAPVPAWLQNAGFIWMPFIAASTVVAWFGMNDLADVKTGFAEQAVIVTRRHNWLMCWLYAGTFGSFIGFSASLPLLIQSQFHRPGAMSLVWLGPLIGVCVRPIGGWLADRFGGGRITFWTFVALALGAAVARHGLPATEPVTQSVTSTVASMSHITATGDLPVFLAAFGVLFVAAGIGNGSTDRMIPAVFMAERQRVAGPLPSEQARRQAAHEGSVESAATLGFASTIGAYGGFFIAKSLGTSIALTGSAASALQVFMLFYLSCLALTWWYYSRRHAPDPC